MANKQNKKKDIDDREPKAPKLPDDFNTVPLQNVRQDNLIYEMKEK